MNLKTGATIFAIFAVISLIMAINFLIVGATNMSWGTRLVFLLGQWAIGMIIMKGLEAYHKGDFK